MGFGERKWVQCSVGGVVELEGTRKRGFLWVVDPSYVWFFGLTS